MWTSVAFWGRKISKPPPALGRPSTYFVDLNKGCQEVISTYVLVRVRGSPPERLSGTTVARIECYCFLIIIIVGAPGPRRRVIYNTFVDGCSNLCNCRHFWTGRQIGLLLLLALACAPLPFLCPTSFSSTRGCVFFEVVLQNRLIFVRVSLFRGSYVCYDVWIFGKSYNLREGLAFCRPESLGIWFGIDV